MKADDMGIAEHIRDHYNYPIPPWVSKIKGNVTDTTAVADDIMAKIKRF